jgi:hypothetical protein
MILNSVILGFWDSSSGFRLLAPKFPSAARIFSTAIKASGARGFQGRSPCLDSPEGSEGFVGSEWIIESPFPGGVEERPGGDSRHGCGSRFPDSAGSVGRVAQMTLVENTFHFGIVVHGSDVVADIIEVQSDPGTGTIDFFFGGASPQSHNRAAILLCLCAAAIEQVSDIIDAYNVGDNNLSGFGVDFHFDEMGLPAHDIQCRMRFSIQGQALIQPAQPGGQ